MAVQLKSRDRPIPFGLIYFQPQTKKEFRNWNFNALVMEVLVYRQGNPGMSQRYNLSMDKGVVEAEVAEYNARVCEHMGWTDYIISSEAPAPKMSAPQQPQQQKLLAVAGARSRELAQGYKAIKAWKAADSPAVPKEQSESRAANCAVCPKNENKPLTDWFVVPFAEAVRKDAEVLNARGLTTSHDAALNTCAACMCPLALKVQVPIEFIAPTVTPEIAAKLAEAPRCWILKEMAETPK